MAITEASYSGEVAHANSSVGSIEKGVEVPHSRKLDSPGGAHVHLESGGAMSADPMARSTSRLQDDQLLCNEIAYTPQVASS